MTLKTKGRGGKRNILSPWKQQCDKTDVYPQQQKGGKKSLIIVLYASALLNK